MRFSASSATADFMVAPGSMLVTSRPLAGSRILTVIVASLGPPLADMPTARAGVNHLNVCRGFTVPRNSGVAHVAVHHDDAENLGSRSELSAWLDGQFRRRAPRVERLEQK